MKTFFQVLLVVVVLLVSMFYVKYGTIDPCGILKKEISMQVKESGNQTAQGLYLIFGSFVGNVIDSMTPLQCVQQMYKIQAEGYQKALSEFEASYTK